MKVLIKYNPALVFLIFIAVFVWGSVEYCSRKWSRDKGIFKETQGMSNRRSVFIVSPYLSDGECETLLS